MKKSIATAALVHIHCARAAHHHFRALSGDFTLIRSRSLRPPWLEATLLLHPSRGMPEARGHAPLELLPILAAAAEIHITGNDECGVALAALVFSLRDRAREGFHFLGTEGLSVSPRESHMQGMPGRNFGCVSRASRRPSNVCPPWQVTQAMSPWISIVWRIIASLVGKPDLVVVHKAFTRCRWPPGGSG